MKQLTEAELRRLLDEAYEQGYEQCAQDGAADFPQCGADKVEYLDKVMDQL